MQIIKNLSLQFIDALKSRSAIWNLIVSDANYVFVETLGKILNDFSSTDRILCGIAAENNTFALNFSAGFLISEGIANDLISKRCNFSMSRIWKFSQFSEAKIRCSKNKFLQVTKLSYFLEI